MKLFKSMHQFEKKKTLNRGGDAVCSNTLDCPLDLQLVMNLRGSGIGAMMRALCYHYHVLGSSPNYVAFSVHIKMPMTEFDLLYFLSNSQSM